MTVGAVLVAAPYAKAIPLDLKAAGSSGSINGAFFTTTANQSTGTGVINPFVRVQDNGIADGYNASARPVMPDVNNSAQFTRDLTLSSVPLVSIRGTAYYEFLLDINQTAANPWLSLDKLDIYTRGTALSTANTLAALTGSSTLRYSLDAGSDSKILLDYNNNNGSGSGDMFAYIPQSVFGAPTDYLYLYSSFGETGGDYRENDGFEEWAVRTPGTTTRVPDGGSTLALVGLAIAGLGLARRKLS